MEPNIISRSKEKGCAKCKKLKLELKLETILEPSNIIQLQDLEARNGERYLYILYKLQRLKLQDICDE